MTPTLQPVVVALLLAGTGTLAWAGRPLATEDAGVLEPGQCEIETFVARATERNAASTRGGSIQFGCGVAGQTQIALATATFRSAGESERSWTFGGKTALGESLGSAWAVAWGLNAVRAPGSSLKHEGTFANGVLTMPLNDALKLHANIGWSHSQGARQSTTGWSLALERSTASGIDIMGETFANDRDKAPWVQFGLRWTAVPDKLFIDTSWGRQTNSARPTLLTLGLKAAF